MSFHSYRGNVNTWEKTWSKKTPQWVLESLTETADHVTEKWRRQIPLGEPWYEDDTVTGGELALKRPAAKAKSFVDPLSSLKKQGQPQTKKTKAADNGERKKRPAGTKKTKK